MTAGICSGSRIHMGCARERGRSTASTGHSTAAPEVVDTDACPVVPGIRGSAFAHIGIAGQTAIGGAGTDARCQGAGAACLQ